MNGRYVWQLNCLPSSRSWHSIKWHPSEGALKSNRLLWLSCSDGQGFVLLGCDPQRAFSLSGAECRSTTSNSTLLNADFIFVLSASGTGQCQGRWRGLRHHQNKINNFSFIYPENSNLLSALREPWRFYIQCTCVSIAILRAAFSKCHSQEIWFLTERIKSIRSHYLTFGVHSFCDKVYVALYHFVFGILKMYSF